MGGSVPFRMSVKIVKGNKLVQGFYDIPWYIRICIFIDRDGRRSVRNQNVTDSAYDLTFF